MDSSSGPYTYCSPVHSDAVTGAQPKCGSGSHREHRPNVPTRPRHPAQSILCNFRPSPCLRLLRPPAPSASGPAPARRSGTKRLQIEAEVQATRRRKQQPRQHLDSLPRSGKPLYLLIHLLSYRKRSLTGRCCFSTRTLSHSPFCRNYCSIDWCAKIEGEKLHDFVQYWGTVLAREPKVCPLLLSFLSF